MCLSKSISQHWTLTFRFLENFIFISFEIKPNQKSDTYKKNSLVTQKNEGKAHKQNGNGSSSYGNITTKPQQSGWVENLSKISGSLFSNFFIIFSDEIVEGMIDRQPDDQAVCKQCGKELKMASIRRHIKSVHRDVLETLMAETNSNNIGELQVSIIVVLLFNARITF